ncbi:MAG: aminodeoxychorismate synthase component I [Desulfobacterales bacterium]
MAQTIENWLNHHIGRITGVHTKPIQPVDAFMDLAVQAADTCGTVALMSDGESDSARFHLLAARPWLTVKAYGREFFLSAGNASAVFEADPFEALERLLTYFAITPENDHLPVTSGLFGYFSYDLKDFIEKLPRTAVNDLSLPHLCLYAPSVIVIYDRQEKCTWQCIPEINGRPAASGREISKGAGAGQRKTELSFASTGDLHAGMLKPAYLAAVAAIKEYIGTGHIYQANLAQRFETDFHGSSFGFFKALFEAAPAPFYAYIHAGDHHIVSTSPERFVRQAGKQVETRPIKGTRPRGRTAHEDQAMRKALVESAKDEAELSMIVDLLRNDFGRVCRAESVLVAEHKRVEAYVNVFHLISVVTGELRDDMKTADLIKAVFPGGSITGCPRIRAMEIIDELEPCQRHIYTGAIGYISFHQTMDLSIAIRTATITGEKLIFSVGGGIVHDSDAEDEYQETLHKGRSLITALAAENQKQPAKMHVWRNGRLEPFDAAAVPIADLGLQYGFGFFETIRVADGRPEFLTEHVRRFNHTWKHLFQTPVPDVSWADIISRVIRKNRLSETTAAVKLMATRGTRSNPPYDHQLVVTARPYVRRPSIAENGGLSLATYPYPRQTPLADFKTMNYLYYYLAGKWAAANGADEALIMNPDGSVSETNTANILVIKGQIVYCPASSHVLEGVMQKQVREGFAQMGYVIKDQPVYPADLLSSDTVLLTNSLIGAVPATSLDGKPLRFNPELCRQICRQISSQDLPAS